MTIPILPIHRVPAMWGLESRMVSPPTSAPAGPHVWEQPTGPRASFRCCKCAAEVLVGTDFSGALSRAAGTSCAEAVVRSVMES